MKNYISLSVNRNAADAFSFLQWKIWRNIMHLLLIISCSVSVSTYMSGQANSNVCTLYCRGKFDPRTGNEGPEVDSFFKLGARWVSTPCPGRFTPGKQTRYPLYSRLGGYQDRCGRVRNTSPPSGLDPQTFQTVAICYTDYALPAHFTEEEWSIVCHVTF